MEQTQGGNRFRFSDAGVHIENSLSKTDYSWTAVHKVRETRSAFLLYWSANFVHVLPFRCFANNSEVGVLREIFRAHVKQARLLGQ
jgi:hypothetical protein